MCFSQLKSWYPKISKAWRHPYIGLLAAVQWHQQALDRSPNYSPNYNQEEEMFVCKSHSPPCLLPLLTKSGLQYPDIQTGDLNHLVIFVPLPCNFNISTLEIRRNSGSSNKSFSRASSATNSPPYALHFPLVHTTLLLGPFYSSHFIDEDLKLRENNGLRVVWHSNPLTPDLTSLFHTPEPLYQHDSSRVERQIEQARKSTLQREITQKAKNYIHSLI